MPLWSSLDKTQGCGPCNPGSKKKEHSLFLENPGRGVKFFQHLIVFPELQFLFHIDFQSPLTVSPEQEILYQI